MRPAAQRGDTADQQELAPERNIIKDKYNYRYKYKYKHKYKYITNTRLNFFPTNLNTLWFIGTCGKLLMMLALVVL